MALVALVLLSAVAAAVDPISYLKAIKPYYTSKPHNVSEIWRDFKPSPKADKIKETSPDIWTVLPKEFDAKYRNPCWTDPATNRFRCAPFFQIIGVSKCGTTDLFARLKKHPELADGSKASTLSPQPSY